MAGPIAISIIGDNRGLNRALDSSESKLRKTGKVAGVVGKAIGAGLLVAGAAAVAWGVSSVKSLARIERINAQTAQAIKSTGGAANVTSGHVQRLAGRLENLTATEAESTQEGANLLLTFTNVRNEAGKGNAIFDRATRTMVDMSRALGTDAKGSALQLGKALNDPIKGVTALQRVGVSFTEQQKSQIKAMVESGRTLDAQKLILRELGKEFGGSGKAFAQTSEGQIELAKHAFGTLGETIFAKVLPPLGQLAGAAAKGLNSLAANGPAIQGVFSRIGAAVGPVVQNIVTGFRASLPAMRSLLGSAMAVAQGFATNVVPQLVAAGGYIGRTFGPVFSQIARIMVGQVVPAVRQVTTFVGGTLMPIIGRTASAIGKNLRPVFDAIAKTLRSDVLPAVQQGAAKFREWWPTISKVISVVARVTGSVLTFAAAVLGKVLPPVIRFQGFLTGNLIRAITLTIGVLVRIGAAVISAGQKFVQGVQTVGRFASAVTSKIGDVIRTVSGLPGKISGALGNLGSLLLNEGSALIQGLINGIIAKAGSIASTIQSYVINKIPGPVRKALGIGSPSRVMRTIGEQTVDGLVRGLRRGRKPLEAQMREVTKALKSAQSTAKAIADLAKNTRTAAIEYGGVAAAAVFGEDGQTSASSITQGLTERLSAIRAFTDKLKQLRTAGLNEDTIASIVAQGIEQGSATAAAIVSGGASAVQEINSLTKQIRGSAFDLAAEASRGVFDQTASEADQLVNRLERQRKRLARQIKNAKRGNRGSGRDRNRANRRERIETHDRTPRARFTDEARRAGRRGATDGARTVAVRLTADQLDQLQRGKAIAVDLKAYQDAGGKL